MNAFHLLLESPTRGSILTITTKCPPRGINNALKKADVYSNPQEHMFTDEWLAAHPVERKYFVVPVQTWTSFADVKETEWYKKHPLVTGKKSITRILQEVEVERRRVYGAPQEAISIRGKVYTMDLVRKQAVAIEENQVEENQVFPWLREEIGGPTEEETTRPPTLPPPGSSQNSELALLAYQNQQREANLEEERVTEEARLRENM